MELPLGDTLGTRKIIEVMDPLEGVYRSPGRRCPKEEVPLYYDVIIAK